MSALLGRHLDSINKTERLTSAWVAGRARQTLFLQGKRGLIYQATSSKGFELFEARANI